MYCDKKVIRVDEETLERIKRFGVAGDSIETAIKNLLDSTLPIEFWERSAQENKFEKLLDTFDKSLVTKVMDISDNHIRNLDYNDNDWMGWFKRNFVGLVVNTNDIKDLLNKIGDDPYFIMAIKRCEE